MKNRRKKTLPSNVEINTEGNASVTGDVVGRDKVTSEYNINIVLDQRVGEQQRDRKIYDSQQKQKLFVQRLISYYSILLAGVGTIALGILLFLGIIGLETALERFTGTAGKTLSYTIEPTSTPQYQASLQTGVTITLAASNCDAKVEIVNVAGDVLLSMIVLPNTAQTINLPPGSYRYNVEYKCAGGLGGASGLQPQAYSSDFALISKSNINVVLPNLPKSNFVLGRVIGVVFLIVGVILILILRRMTYPTWKDIVLLPSAGDRTVANK